MITVYPLEAEVEALRDELDAERALADRLAEDLATMRDLLVARIRALDADGVNPNTMTGRCIDSAGVSLAAYDAARKGEM